MVNLMRLTLRDVHRHGDAAVNELLIVLVGRGDSSPCQKELGGLFRQ